MTDLTYPGELNFHAQIKIFIMFCPWISK